MENKLCVEAKQHGAQPQPGPMHNGPLIDKRFTYRPAKTNTG